MSDQLFLGVAPKSDAGKEYFFYSMDDWIEIHRFIWSEVSDEFPPYPNMDSETAEMLADRVQKLLDFGVAHAYFLLAVRKRYMDETDEGSDDDIQMTRSLWISEDEDGVERMVDLLSGYTQFLRESGGCKVGDFDI